MSEFPESKLDWLIEKFGQHQGWLKAADISEKIYRKHKKAEDCRKLMSLAVEKGHAFSSDSYPCAPKNSIAFNPPYIFDTCLMTEDCRKLMSLAVEKGHAFSSDSYPCAPKNSIAFNLPYIFDTCLMTDPRFGYMPKNLFKTMGWCLDSPEFFVLEHEWRLVYSLLCSFQYHGLPDYELLAETQVIAETQVFECEFIFVFPNPPKLTKHLVLSAKKIASYYLLIKLAYMECYKKNLLPHSNPRPDGYIELFLCFLWDDYERRYILLKNKPNHKIKPRTRLNLYETFFDGESDMEKRTRNILKFAGRQDADFDVPIGSHLIIKEIVNSCDSQGVKVALDRLVVVNEEFKKSALKELRSQARKKTGEKVL
jgi:hypothetical protein